MQLADDVAQIYARALIAIARADGEITGEEGQALDRIITARAAVPLSLAELMFAPALQPEQLAKLAGSYGEGGPFRTAPLELGELARQLVDDALAVVFAKGSISAAEERSLTRFADALGVSKMDVAAQIARASRVA